MCIRDRIKADARLVCTFEDLSLKITLTRRFETSDYINKINQHENFRTPRPYGPDNNLNN